MTGQDNYCVSGTRYLGVNRPGASTHVLVPDSKYLVDEAANEGFAATLACSGLTAYSAAAKLRRWRRGPHRRARLRRPRPHRHLDPARTRREEHRRLRYRREARGRGQDGRQGLNTRRRPRQSCKGSRRRSTSWAVPPLRRWESARCARRPLRHLRPLWRRTRASFAADCAARDRHRRLVRGKSSGA